MSLNKDLDSYGEDQFLEDVDDEDYSDTEALKREQAALLIEVWKGVNRMAEIVAKNTENLLKAPTIKLQGGDCLRYSGIHAGGISLEVSGVSLTNEVLAPIVREWELSIQSFDNFMWVYLKGLKVGKQE